MRISADIVVNQPVEKVWEAFSSIEAFEKWAPDASDARQTSEGPFGLGSTFSLKYTMGGRTNDISGSVTAFQPSSRLGLKLLGGPMPMDEVIDLASSGGGTRVTFTVDVRPKNPVLGILFIPFSPLLGIMIKRQAQKEVRALKKHLESE